MFLSSGVAVWAFFAAANAQPVHEDTIRALVEKLGAPDFRTREQANRDLLALGDAARPALLKAATATDKPEVERRLDVLIAKLDRERLVQPKRITLRGKYPVEELLKQISKQTGYAFSEFANDRKLAMIVNWKDKTFWDAVDEIAAATGFSIQFNGDETNSIGLSENDALDPHIFRNGPYRFVATNIGTNANRQLSGLPRRGLPNLSYGGANINFSLYSEPKNPMLGVGTTVLTRALDDTGVNLIPTEDSRYFSSYYQGGVGQRSHNLYIYANLGKPGKDATVIKVLRGKVPVTLLAGTRPELTIDQLTTVQNKTFVSRTTEVTVESVTVQGASGLTMVVTAKLLRPNPEDYTWSAALPQRLEVSDAAGTKFINSGVVAQNQAPGSTTVTVQFTSPTGKKIGPPARLVLMEWLAVQRDIEFAFEGIPLP